MRYNALVEPIGAQENMPGYYYAYVPSLGLTAHGKGIEGALGAARDLIGIWTEEKRAVGEQRHGPDEGVLATVEVD